MKEKSEQKFLGLSMFFNTCIMFTFSTFFLWCFSILVDSSGRQYYFKPEINLVLVAISLFVSIIISIICSKIKKPYIYNKIKVLYYLSVAYTILYFIYNLIAFILGDIWTAYAIITIFAASMLFSLVEAFIKFKSMLPKVIINFFIFAIPYFFTTTFMGYCEGNKLFKIFAIYLLAYVLIYTIVFLVKFIIYKFQNNSSKYEQLFK